MTNLRICYLILLVFAASSLQAEDPKVAPTSGSTVTLKFGDESAHNGFAQNASALAALLGALAWPLVVASFLFAQRHSVTRVIDAVSDALVKSKKIKFGDTVEIEVDRSAQEASERSEPPREIPRRELEAAARVNILVPSSEISFVRDKMLGFAREYESTRANMQPSPARTRAMNAIVAKMRTMALAAQPLLREFSDAADSAGKRLVAITILQLSPSLEYLDWLVDRMGKEAPFVFYHASIALRAAVHSYGSFMPRDLSRAIRKSVATLQSFKDGPPDRNTLETLELALSELGPLADAASAS